MHLAGPVENGWRVVNVVPSRQESENFAREQLLPALRPLRGACAGGRRSRWRRGADSRKSGPTPLSERKWGCRIAHEITTTLASAYTSQISLAEALDPEVIRRYHRVATGEKYLLSPIRTDPADRCQNDKGASLRQSERVACRRSAT